MKRFIVSVLTVSVFFLGLGSLAEKAGARSRSDEKALALISAARAAIGGDTAIAAVQSLKIVGRSTHTFKVDGTERTEAGDVEIAMQLPDKFSKMVRMGKNDGNGGEQSVDRRVETIVIRRDKDGNESVGRGEGEGLGVGTEPGGKKIVIKKHNGAVEELSGDDADKVIIRRGDTKDLPLKTADGSDRRVIIESEIAAHHDAMRQNELFRLTLGLLLSSPAGTEANYTFGGEIDVDGTPCNLVVAELAGSTIKLYLNRSSNLPVMMAYTGGHLPIKAKFDRKVSAPESGAKDTIIFRKMNAGDADAEFQVRFSDYRSVSGVQLPYRWTTTAGEMREVLDVTNYDVNPANIADSFKDRKLMVRTKKPEGQ